MRLSILVGDQSKSYCYLVRRCTTSLNCRKELIKGIQINAKFFKLILINRQCVLRRGATLREINLPILLAVFLTVTLHLTASAAAAALNLSANVTKNQTTITSSSTFLCRTSSPRHNCFPYSLTQTAFNNSRKQRHCKQQKKICNCDFHALNNVKKELDHRHNKSNEYSIAGHRLHYSNNSTYAKTNSLITAYNYDKLISNYSPSNQTSFRNSRDAKSNCSDGNSDDGKDYLRNCLKKLNFNGGNNVSQDGLPVIPSSINLLQNNSIIYNKQKHNISINNYDLAKYLVKGAHNRNNNDENIRSLLNVKSKKDRLNLLKLVMDGLGLQQLPNMEKINISQQEYAAKYGVYLQRVRSRNRREIGESAVASLQILSVPGKRYLADDHYNTSKESRRKRDFFLNDLDFFKNNKRKHQIARSAHKQQRDKSKLNVHLLFALTPQTQQWSATDIEEANIRLMLIHNPSLALLNRNKKKLNNRKKPKEAKNNSCINRDTNIKKHLNKQRTSMLNLRVFHITHHGKRRWLDGRKVPVNINVNQSDQTSTQWLQFNVTKAIIAILLSHKSQLEVILQCDNCKRLGARLYNDGYSGDVTVAGPAHDFHLMPTLNIIGRFGQSPGSIRAHESFSETSTVRQYQHHSSANHRELTETRHHNCYKVNQRCCRHSMEVVFKEIKGFEFILQPKAFDAGYCHGRCPARYNPAHHHAMLQGLIWKQDHHRAPRPCCAPSKLDDLEILHVDEKDSKKLKISTWSEMRVVECACS
uniref:TGF-beta family profile domain-containing protein n=1 Tax=Glossina brevipalpis TaxID=37001 RepID=A0A1A9W3I4_9MUSC